LIRPTWQAATTLVAGAALFIQLATMNAAGYRYGAADQAFYLPSVLDAIDPGLYPADHAVLAAQDALMPSDEIVGGLARASGVSVPVVFLAGYLLSLTLLYGAGIAFARALGQSWWGAALLAVILTLRHRIPKTGVNTLEGYFHPRILAFGVGVAAAGLFLRGRTLPALALVAVAAIVHPTIGLWLACWLGVAAIVADLRLRRWLVAAAAPAAAAAVTLTAGPMRGRLVRIDDAWMSVIAAKDYLFPADWRLDAWLLNLAAPLVLLAMYRRRQQRGIASAREWGLVAGALVLVGVFLLSVVLTELRLALAVQLQVSRVFWLIEFAAIAYLVAQLDLQRRTVRIVTAVLLAVSIGRGWYVMRVEHPGRPVWLIGLPHDEWHDAMQWVARTPGHDAVLTDPGHAYRYGTSVRVAAQRDVYLEEVKDAALAIYSREVAMRVRDRVDQLGDYATLSAAHAGTLGQRYNLRYFVSERPFDLPEVYRNGRFHVYDLAR
jgi:hypothetical protein